MNNKAEETILELARNHLKRNPANWIAIGDALKELEDFGTRNEDGVAWSEVIAKLYEEEVRRTISRGHMNKIRRVHDFVRKIQKEEDDKITDEQILSSKMTSLEIVNRLYNIDKSEGLKALHQLIYRKIKIRQVQKIYDEFLDENPTKISSKTLKWKQKKGFHGAYESQLFLKRVIFRNPSIFTAKNYNYFTLIEQPLDKIKIFGDYDMIDTDHIITINTAEETLLLGIYFIDGHSKNPSEISIEKVFFRSTLYDKYWVVVYNSYDTAERIIKYMNELMIYGIGVLKIYDDHSLSVLREPSEGVQKTDRRDLVRDYIRNDLKSPYI